MLNTVPLVVGGFSLVAFIVAAIYYAYRDRLKTRSAEIAAAPVTDRVEMATVLAERYNLNTKNLPPDSVVEIVLEELRIKAAREKSIANAFIVVAVLLAVIAILAIIWPQPPKPNPDPIEIPPKVEEEPTKPRTKIQTVASFTVCIGERDSGCPGGAVRLGCGTNVANWAVLECRKYQAASETLQISSKGGNRCGYSVVNVTCTVGQ